MYLAPGPVTLGAVNFVALCGVIGAAGGTGVGVSTGCLDA